MKLKIVCTNQLKSILIGLLFCSTTMLISHDDISVNLLQNIDAREDISFNGLWGSII